jgi:Fic family protein
VVDAAIFQHRVEDAASVIQRHFRKTLHASSSEETENTYQSSVENEGGEEKNVDAAGTEQETNEEGEDEDENDENLITAVFLAMFAVGMSLYKVMAKCMSQMDDSFMPTQTGTPQAAPQTVPVPQPPP